MSHAGRSDGELDFGGERVKGDPLVDGPTGGASPLWAVLDVMEPSGIDHRCLRRCEGLCVSERPRETAPCGAKNPIFRDVDKIEEGGRPLA